MSGLTLNARQSPRISVDKLKVIDTPTPVVEDISVDNKRTTAFEAFSSINPAFKLLVDKLDLEEVGHQQIVVKNEDGKFVPSGDTQAPPPKPAGPVNLDKLKGLAEKTFEQQCSYTEDEAIALLATMTNVPIERARNGFRLMLDHSFLSQTATNTFYLTNTIPF